VIVVLGALVGVTSLVALVIELPYYTIGPGGARSAADTIIVEGVESYPTDDVLFTTVSLRPGPEENRHINGWEWLQAELDGDIDLVPAEQVDGGRSPEENGQINQALMDESEDTAVVVALEHLGFDVISGTGATIGGVLPGSPAEEVLEPGDTIVRVEAQPVDRREDLVRELDGTVPGDEITIVVEPEDGPRRRETVTLGAFTNRQDAPCLLAADEVEGEVVLSDQSCLGVSGLATRDEERDYPFEVSIDPGRVRGPSAGLAFTLAVLDVLTPGDLTGGETVAVTGTIDGLGNVGPVGGAQYKAVAARSADASVFLVPVGEEEIAAEKVGDDIRIVPVATLDDALDALADLGGNALDLEAPVPSAE
jgi:PDZ domain-containing protein